ncbi:MAG: radical SAM protein, partial [Terriglobales bacterium]
MNKTEVLRAWGTVLAGRTPVLSIEITKQCPLRCPGCYAFDAAHLGGATPLRGLADRKGEELVSGVLAIVDRLRPLHVSLVGGDPLVRYRELERLLPQLQARGVHTQVVTSAFRPIPATWRAYPHVNVVVSVDGLQPEHDARRQPATYGRILKNIAAARVTVHCTITAQLLARPG